MKFCINCKQDKELDEFIIRKNGVINYWCKLCVREAARISYNKNREKCIERGKEKNQKFRKHIYDYLLNHPCVDCGETDPMVLDFDHRNSKEKSYNIANMKMMSLDKVDEEIAKCDARCANCHRRRTAKQQNWYRFLNLVS